MKAAKKQTSLLIDSENKFKYILDICSSDELKTIGKYLKEYYDNLLTAPVTSQRFYTGVNEFTDHVTSVPHRQLKESGFINGNPVANGENNVASFVWNVLYRLYSDWHYSPICHDNHHASTEVRQSIIKTMMIEFIQIYCERLEYLAMYDKVGQIYYELKKIN